MPRSTNRRETLAAAVITVLAQKGTHGLTHRAVDSAAQVPTGTTSRYFRSRAALLLVAAETVRDQHRAYIQNLVPAVSLDHTGLIDALSHLIVDATETNRDLYLARFELILESTRNPPLREIMEEVRAANLAVALRLIQAAGIELDAKQIDILGSLLLGITVDRLTLARPRASTKKIITALLNGVLPTDTLLDHNSKQSG